MADCALGDALGGRRLEARGTLDVPNCTGAVVALNCCGVCDSAPPAAAAGDYELGCRATSSQGARRHARTRARGSWADYMLKPHSPVTVATPASVADGFEHAIAHDSVSDVSAKSCTVATATRKRGMKRKGCLERVPVPLEESEKAEAAAALTTLNARVLAACEDYREGACTSSRLLVGAAFESPIVSAQLPGFQEEARWILLFSRATAIRASTFSTHLLRVVLVGRCVWTHLRYARKL